MAASDSKARLSLDAVYTALLTTGSDADRDLTAREATMREPREMRRLSALEQLDRHARLVLLGSPGSGKSTFVNFVALCLCGEARGDPQINLLLLTQPLPPEQEEQPGRDKQADPQPQPWRHGALIPVRVVLREFAARGLPASNARATAEHLWQFIAGGLQTAMLTEFAPLLQAELRGAGGLLLLDGLDEVPEANQCRVQIKQAVEDFAKAFPKCRILVTSRTYAYQKQDWRLTGFEATELAPFSDGQIRRFVENWYLHTASLRKQNTQDAQGKAVLLKNAIFSNPRLRELAERPLLLTLMASLHAWRSGSLPEKREELYADAVDLLLDQWERPKVLFDTQGNVVAQPPRLSEQLKVDRDKLRRVLEELAFQVHASQTELQGTGDVPEKELVTRLFDLNPDAGLNPRDLMNYLSQRAGLLIPHGVGVYTYPHRTFQEYLAACYLTNYKFPAELARLARTDPNRWREAALLAAAKTKRGADYAMWGLIDRLCHRAPAPEAKPDDEWGARIAGQALAETLNLTLARDEVQEESFQRVRGWQVQLLASTRLPAVERAGAGEVLACLEDPRKEVLQVGAMEFCVVPPGPFVMGADDKDAKKHTNKTLDYPYWLARFPVTNAQYRAFVQAGGYAARGFWAEAEQVGFWREGKFKGRYDNDARETFRDYGAPFNLSNHPVVGVSWYEALAFCRWLNEAYGKQLPQGYRFILPSEAEWEKAARGGMQIPAQPYTRSVAQGLAWPASLPSVANRVPEREYPWDGAFDANRANTMETGIGTTSAVGCFARGVSPYGIEELSGNVWEWTRSVYKSYPYQPQDGREKLNAGANESRVVRGGAFFDPQGNARCAPRDYDPPYSLYYNQGFRVAASLARL
ncbi:MAG: SUMF1/EgtB/PvdO family nonheme iron enzyme [Anaerolineae bacterium]